MRYIKPCPECKTDLRFPLDRGVLVVKCPRCNTKFFVDPSDPSTFQDGQFDYPRTKINTTARNELSSSIQTTIQKIFTEKSVYYIKRLIPFILVFLLSIHLIRIFNFTESSMVPAEDTIKQKLPPGHPPITDPPQEDRRVIPDKLPEYQI